jgi:hypothetical protein
MAYLSQYYTYPMRSTNKEPQWATVYDDLFNQYIDTDGFEFGTYNAQQHTSSSDEASTDMNTFNSSFVEAFTDSSEESSSSSEAQARRDSDEFWAKTLLALEESAATLENEQEREQSAPCTPPSSSSFAFYNTKNEHHPHADFLSLGGFPSPHISSSQTAATSPSSPSEAARRRKASSRYGNQRERATKTPERGRAAPIGVTKSYRCNTTTSRSKSPKMMSPSRFRAGGPQDAWVQSLHHHDLNHHAITPITMTLPVRSMPLTPPSSARKPFAAPTAAIGLGFSNFCSPSPFDTAPFQSYAGYEGEEQQVSPASFFDAKDSFAQSHPQEFPRHLLYSPDASPLTTPGVERRALFEEGEEEDYDDDEEQLTSSPSYYHDPLAAIDHFNKNNAWSANSFAAEDVYQPSPTFSPWTASEKQEAEFRATNSQQQMTLPVPLHEDPTLAPIYTEDEALIAASSSSPRCSPYYISTAAVRELTEFNNGSKDGIPRTPSPSPTPLRRHKRDNSSSSSFKMHTRKSSSGEHKKQSSSCSSSSRKASKKTGGFVNYTPFDSEKLLTGVAPSGSSKTKMRREKETAEKWRRFSQAAVKAVADAGGDLAPVIGTSADLVGVASAW